MYYLFTANSAKNPDGQNRAEMNYFHGLGKAGFGMARPASGAYAREFLGLEGRRTLVILFFSPRIRADISAALVDTEEN